MDGVQPVNNQYAYVEGLAKRIESLLPNRTGHSTQEVELNPQYLITKRILLESHNKHPQMITYIFTTFASILLTLGNESEFSKLRLRDEKSRGSTLLVCKLLSEILKSDWNRETSSFDDKDLLSNYSKFYYYDKPKRLDSSKIVYLLDTFVNLLSSGVVRKILALVRNQQSMTTIAIAKDEQDILREDQPMTDEELTAASVAEVDSYVEIIIRYIATANPDDYYQYIVNKLFKYSMNDETIPLPMLQKYCPLLKFLFYSDANAERAAEDSLSAIPYIRSNTWRQVFLFFLSTSIKDQAFSRTQDYKGIVDPSNVRYVNILKNLFDSTSMAFDDNLISVTCASFVLTWFLVLCLDDFQEINSSRPINKLKLTFNKRMKYIMMILKESASASNLESFDALINIFHLGTRLQAHNYIDHPVFIFSIKFLDQTHRNLLSFGEVHKDELITNEEMLIKYEFLLVNFYIAAILLRPERYSKIVIENYQKNSEDLREAKILVKVVKGLSEIETGQEIFRNILMKLRLELKSMIYGSLKILDKFESENSQLSQAPTSLAEHSLYSDVVKLQCTQLVNDIAVHVFEANQTSLDHYAEELLNEIDARDSLLNNDKIGNNGNKLTPSPTSSVNTHSGYKYRLINGAEELLADIFNIFQAAPELYFNDEHLMNDDNLKTKSEEELVLTIVEFCREAVVPLRQALKSKGFGLSNSRLFDSARDLSLMLVASSNNITTKFTTLSAFANYNLINYIIQSICETCLGVEICETKFKACFVFLNEFLNRRQQFKEIVKKNKLILDYKAKHQYSSSANVIHSVEKVLLLSLCTHDIQFYNYAKDAIRWYVNELTENFELYQKLGLDMSLFPTFKELTENEGVFTGFISLHKRHRTIMRRANPSKSLYEVCILIYYRWLKILESQGHMNEDSLVFRHFTGFLASISGSFNSAAFGARHPDLKDKANNYLSDFFDKCIGLLNSPDLVVRVIVKDTLSNELHSDIYQLITTKLMNLANEYADKPAVTEEGVVFVEQAMVIMTAMIGTGSDGTLLLAALLPNICQFFLKFISMIDNPTDKLRLKLRFCKLGATLESDRESCGLSGAYKLRNFYAKASLEWLEHAIFYEEQKENFRPHLPWNDSESITNSSKESEIAYLSMDLAVQCSKCLRGQLEELVLEIPEGVRDSEIHKYKDLAFSSYFSIIFKIIQKHSKMNLSANKYKHKLNQISDNILACITNLLQYDSDIGMQFVLPMGYHENPKVRAIFLNVFANMLSTKTIRNKKEEFPDELIEDLTNQTEIFAAIAETASSAEHNLLASALFVIFSYTKKLDKLFEVLLTDEVARINRSTDLFRRNSTLTRLLFSFTQDCGLQYLNQTIKPIIEEIVNDGVKFEVEKVNSTDDSDAFMRYFTKLINQIVNSVEILPDSFKFVCSEIYNSISSKFAEPDIIPVGSFIFLRYICPAIISPEQFFKIPVTHPKVKRSLMQLVKVLQNMANGTLTTIKWQALSEKHVELVELNKKIFEFLKQVSTLKIEGYPFLCSRESKPLAELRYLHKFIYVYYINIRMSFILAKLAVCITNLHDRVVKYKAFDRACKELGQPKPSVQLQLNSYLKLFDPNSTTGSVNITFNDFMTKMSLKYADTPPDAIDVIHSSIFKDGTPVVVVNLKKMKKRPDDVNYLVYKLFETASQVWDNKFYLVFDFTEFVYNVKKIPEYIDLLTNYSAEQLFKNCQRVYYFNIPRSEYSAIARAVDAIRSTTAEYGTKIYMYSQFDSDEIINSLCLDKETVAISRDNKVIFRNILLYEPNTKKYTPVYLKIGRKFLQVCFIERVVFDHDYCVTPGFTPVEIYRLSDFAKCEVSDYSNHDDEFTIFLSYGHLVTFRSRERLEILRFLYFTTSRLPRESTELTLKDYQNDTHSMHWFGRLYNIVFQGLLSADEEVRQAAVWLFGALSSYFDIDFGIKEHHAKSISFPANSTDFVVSVSEHLATTFPQLSYRFFKSFFDNYDKMPEENKLTSILYVSPWIENIYDHVYLLSDENGPERVADLIRQFCRLSSKNKEHIAFINDYIWKKLFLETRLMQVLVDEVVAFAIDSKNEGPDWSFIIAVISPSIEVCGEVISRLISCINNASTGDSAIACQSKLFEIKVLIKICSSLFFNSYVLARLYLADLIFFVTLFIDNSHLDVGADLQRLIISLIQSFLHKPDLTEKEQKTVDETIEYFSTPRAKMLFGMTRDSSSGLDISQTFNRISNFEILCDYLNGFISVVSTSDDNTNWKSRWCSNAIDVAFTQDSLFQDRAILVVGILSKNGVNDSTACRTLKLVSGSDLNSLDFVVCIFVAISRILQGLPDTSVLPPVVIWAQFSFALLNNSAHYQAALQNIITSVLKIIRVGKDYIANSFSQRVLLEPYLSQFERRHGYEITPRNFGVYIFFILTQGLRFSQFKQLSLTCIKEYFATRYFYRERTEMSGKYISNNAYAYLVFAYLCSDNQDFVDYVSEIELETEYVTIAENQTVPKVIIDFLLENSEASKATLIHAGFFFNDINTSDGGFKAKFVQLYNYLFKIDREIGFLIFDIMRPTLTQDLINTNSLEVVEVISNIINDVSLCEDYHPEKYMKEVDDLLERNKITILKSLRKMNNFDNIVDENGKFTAEFDLDIKNIQVMVYRSACVYVEGLRLED